MLAQTFVGAARPTLLPPIAPVSRLGMRSENLCTGGRPDAPDTPGSPTRPGNWLNP